MIIAEINGARVEVYRSYRCWEAHQNGHFQFRFLDSPTEQYAKHGFRVGDVSWECCRAGKFKNWRREVLT